MSEVKRYYVHWNDQRYVDDPKNGNLVMVEDFDRVTAERDAALETVVLKHRDMVEAQTAVTGWARKFDALQALLTAADERADVLEGLLRLLAELPGVRTSGMWERVVAALKPAEGRNETNCLLCLDKKTVPSNLAEGYVMDCPDCCGEEG